MRKSVLLIIIIAITHFVFCEELDSKEEEFRSLPNVKIKTLKGKKISSKKLTENKFTMMSFWATWCVPCLKEMKELNIMHHKYEDNNFQVVGISIDDTKTAKKISTILKSKKISYPIYLDTEQKFFGQFNSEALPFSFLVSPEGKILWEHSGYIPGDEKEIEAVIVDALGLKTSDPGDSTSMIKPD
jgi:peroxiredoxin|tara:strand:+ start:1058 stop:1615 length:558 start_codon:yes stop_codon:yes gene_type:complete